MVRVFKFIVSGCETVDVGVVRVNRPGHVVPCEDGSADQELNDDLATEIRNSHLTWQVRTR